MNALARMRDIITQCKLLTKLTTEATLTLATHPTTPPLPSALNQTASDPDSESDLKDSEMRAYAQRWTVSLTGSGPVDRQVSERLTQDSPRPAGRRASYFDRRWPPTASGATRRLRRPAKGQVSLGHAPMLSTSVRRYIRRHLGTALDTANIVRKEAAVARGKQSDAAENNHNCQFCIGLAALTVPPPSLHLPTSTEPCP